jgi:hypothetical protein
MVRLGMHPLRDPGVEVRDHFEVHTIDVILKIIERDLNGAGHRFSITQHITIDG